MTNRTWRRSVVSWTLVMSCAIAPMAAASEPADGSKAATTPAATPAPLFTRAAIDAALQSPDARVRWEADIAAARAKRSEARKQQYGGLVLGITGYVVMFAGVGHCETSGSCSNGLAWVGLGTLVYGTAMGIKGSLRAHDADGEVNALIARGPERTIAISLGAEKSVGYRITW